MVKRREKICFWPGTYIFAVSSQFRNIGVIFPAFFAVQLRLPLTFPRLQFPCFYVTHLCFSTALFSLSAPPLHLHQNDLPPVARHAFILLFGPVGNLLFYSSLNAPPRLAYVLTIPAACPSLASACYEAMRIFFQAG